jgi:hypothetical protein
MSRVFGQEFLDPDPAIRGARDDVGEGPAAIDGEGP